MLKLIVELSDEAVASYHDADIDTVDTVAAKDMLTDILKDSEHFMEADDFVISYVEE